MMRDRQADTRRTFGRRWAAVGVVLLGFFLRVHRIGEQRVWWDEGWSVWVARFPAADILRQTGNDVHPPLYFELLHLWRLLSGDGEAGLRLLSAFLGTLTIALTYALGRRMARGTLSPGGAALAALLAALFLAVSRFAIAWSQEIRMYALASLLAVLAVWAAQRVWGRGRPVDAALYVGATAAGLYTLYLFAPVWAAVNVAWLWTLREASDRRRALLRWVGLQLLVAALFLPWLWYAAGGFLSTAAATPISLIDFLHIYWTVLTVGIPVDVAQFNRLTIPALAIFIAAITSLIVRVTSDELRVTNDELRVTSDELRVTSDELRVTSDERRLLSSDEMKSGRAARDLTLLLVVLLLPAAIVYVVSLPKQNFYNPPFNPRYLVIFTSFYSILLAWGVATLGEWLGRRVFSGGRATAAARIATLVMAGFMLAVSFAGMRPYYPGRVLVDDYPSLVSTIDAHRRPNDAVILYTDTDWPIFAYHHPDAWRGVPHLWDVTPETAEGFLQPIWDEHDAIWLVTTPYSAGGDPQRHVPGWLAERAAAVREFTYKDMALTLFARTEERAALADALVQNLPPNALDVPLADGSRLTGYAQAARDFKSGDVIHLFLYRAPGGEVTTQIGLFDGRNIVFGPRTITFPDMRSDARQQVDLIVPPEAPSGDYRFFVIDADGQPAPFGRLTITQRGTAFLTAADVAIPNRIDAQFDQGIRLMGYDLAATTARPGEAVGLTLYWSSDGGVAQRYKVFTHLLGDVFNADGGNFLWGQADNEPAANRRPTTTWREGEVIVDEYAIPVHPDAPPGTYRIEVGLYDAITGERLPVLDADGVPVADHVILTVVGVE